MEQEASFRKRNEEADKRAVEAAAENAAPSQLAERRRQVVKAGRMNKTEAGREDVNLRELVVKENERSEEARRTSYMLKTSRETEERCFLHTRGSLEQRQAPHRIKSQSRQES